MVAALTIRDGAAGDRAPTDAMGRPRGATRQALRGFWRYVQPHGKDITQPETPSLGAMEGEVYHRGAHRTKRHGAQWSEVGNDPLVRLLATAANGTLGEACARVRPTPGAWAGNRNSAPPLVRREPGARDGAWLQAPLRAVQGPHADRPWVRWGLRELAGLAAG
ncbi:MAG: hypothetical protein K6U14_09255 [Firmicutes bacterium]|nr:hypothetical protein [Alicyclobacillaceae bacterium]MCL6497798.1 hypothetical protein [Bacillota bacterium]